MLSKTSAKLIMFVHPNGNIVRFDDDHESSDYSKNQPGGYLLHIDSPAELYEAMRSYPTFYPPNVRKMMLRHLVWATGEEDDFDLSLLEASEAERRYVSRQRQSLSQVKIIEGLLAQAPLMVNVGKEAVQDRLTQLADKGQLDGLTATAAIVDVWEEVVTEWQSSIPTREDLAVSAWLSELAVASASALPVFLKDADPAQDVRNDIVGFFALAPNLSPQAAETIENSGWAFRELLHQAKTLASLCMSPNEDETLVARENLARVLDLANGLAPRLVEAYALN
jgi:hypothetical protein